jgi:hypothetical protein
MDERSRIQEVLARYVRATDARDGARQGALFTDDAVVRIFSKTVEGAHADYDSELLLVDDAWKITRHHVLQDLPLALPDAGPAPSGRA